MELSTPVSYDGGPHAPSMTDVVGSNSFQLVILVISRMIFKRVESL